MSARGGSTIDLNADLGETAPNVRPVEGEGLLDLVTSANVACGFHAGGPCVMDAVVAGAARRGITVGAHVSYPDLAGFGRRHLDVSPAELVADVLYQIGALDGICRRHGTAVRYVKAHGALYNDLATDPALAAVFADAVCAFDPAMTVLALPGSAAEAAVARAGLPVRREGFPDRGYTADGTLAPRTVKGAVLGTVEEVAARGVKMARGEPIEACTGAAVTVRPETLCVHSDTPGAAAMARALRRALAAAGVEVRAFA